MADENTKITEETKTDAPREQNTAPVPETNAPVEPAPEKEPEKNKSWTERIIIIILLIIIIILLLLRGCTGCVGDGNTTGQNDSKPLNIDKAQNTYVEPETPINRAKQISLPGWGGFTIPANTTSINKGFEFHNPQENIWYEDSIYIGDTFIEKMVVDSGEKTSLTHLVRVGNVNSKVTEVLSYDDTLFSISEEPVDPDSDSEETELYIEAIAPYEEDQTVTVKCENGKEVELKISCYQDYYYMTFSLYLGDSEDGEPDTLLYESGLVEPGMFIQQMEMTQPLAPGEYEAYVDIQPYKSDKVTKTNSGTVQIKLTVG